MRRLVVVAALLGGLLACGGGEGEASTRSGPRAAPKVTEPERGHFVRTTQQGKYVVDVQFDPGVPPLGELFAVDAVLTDRDGVPIESAEVQLDAAMPHHDHGMETQPQALPGTCEDEVCTHPEGRFRSEGFKFHMPGEWTVTVNVKGPRGPDSTSFVYEML